MRVVIFEYISSGVCKPESLYPDLIKEADLIVNELGQKMTEAGCDLVLFRSRSLPPPLFEAEIIPLDETDDWNTILEDELYNADAYLPLAPESDALLENLCLKAEQTHCTLLNTSAHTVRETSNKQYTLKRLATHRIPCVSCYHIDQCTFPMPEDVVIKPNNRLACEYTFLIRAGDMPTSVQKQHAQICQPYLQGTDASLSIIYASDSKPCILGVNRQEITVVEQNCFQLNACRVNALAHLELDFEGLAVDVQKCFTGLLGYVGIDIIICDEIPYILEINPRLTTSFAGLAKSTSVNPCAMLLAAVYGEPLPCPQRSEFTDYTVGIT